MRLSVTVPQVLLGLPMKGSQNPYLVSPAGAAGFEASYEEGCSGLRVDNVRAEVAGKLSNFWSRLASGLGLSGCASLSLTSGRSWSPSSLYAASTVALLHVVARSHADVLNEYEIVEMGRMADPWEGPPWWQAVIDALRFSSATGKVVAYRSEEEAVELVKASVSVTPEASEAVGEGVGAEELGESVYNALVHIIGELVLEASEEVRGEGDLAKAALKRLRVQNAVAHAIYGVRTPEAGCVWVPGLPGVLELVCPGG
ncbi:MAG: hypothetical protein OSP8Acid_14260 [uncultured Acidilobus sp. OSP8]|nr:MAG: hypothetical protein OSP8Acid_14260 [uncultured Acidilobus sp. OSP8]